MLPYPHAWAIASALIVAFAAVAIAPSSASEDAGELLVTVTITSTLPRVTATVLVTDGDGEPVAGAPLEVVNVHDLAPLPAATLSSVSTSDGTALLVFPTASTAQVPGPHTVLVVATLGAGEGEGSAGYSIP